MSNVHVVLFNSNVVILYYINIHIGAHIYPDEPIKIRIYFHSKFSIIFVSFTFISIGPICIEEVGA